jgi:transcriptional regulator with XRE-family HTH domain
MLDEQKVDLSTLGKRLTYSIKISRLTRRQVASLVGIPLSHLSDYEKDLETPDGFEMKALSDVLKTPLGWLLYGTHESVDLA